MLCHQFYASWHLPSIAYHGRVELSVSNAIERQSVGANANPYVMPADVHRLICPGAIKYCYDRKHAFQLSLMEFMPLGKIVRGSPHQVNALPALHLVLDSREQNLSILVIHACQLQDPFSLRKSVMCSFFIGVLDHGSSYTTLMFLSSVPTIGVLPSPRYFGGFSSSPKLRHLHPNRGRRTLLGEHSATRCTCVLSKTCSRARLYCGTGLHLAKTTLSSV
jgi:hypothetical protein